MISFTQKAWRNKQSLKQLYFRADANTEVGVGHLMRCLALAQEAKQRGWRSVFIGHMSSRLVTRIQSEGFEIASLAKNLSTEDDLECLLKVAKDGSPIVIDHYALGSEYQKRVRDANHPLLVIDDYNHQHSYAADLLLNPNLSAHRYHYNTKADLLLGPQFSLLRAEFLAYPRPSAKNKNRIRNILISMGGSDPQNFTLEILKALDLIHRDEWQVKAILGPANPWIKTIECFSAQSRLSLDLHLDVGDMAGMYAWADAALTGSGSTVYELAYFRLPSAIVCLADNQRDVADELKRQKIVYTFDNALCKPELARRLDLFLTDKARAQRFAAAIGSLVDGFGARRVMDSFLGYAA